MRAGNAMTDIESTFKIKLPPAFQSYLKPDAPKDARLMAASGLIPAPPAVLAAVLTFFLNDPDTEVREAARKSLLDMPTGMLKGILRDPSQPETLDFFAREKTADSDLVELILLNPETSDGTFLFLADKVSEAHATMIMNNQVRLLRTPAIAEAVKKNPNALRSAVDTMVSFLRMNGTLLEGESVELTAEEIRQILSAPEPSAVSFFPAELTEEQEDEEPEPEKKKTLTQMVMTMNVAQKIKLALRGNKEARNMLIKDSNKIVASSVVKSPKISDLEIVNICNMRTVHDEVIRIISNKQEYTRQYPVQVALANNPKTPFPIALKFVRQLRLSDLEKISKNKNVAGQLSKIAKELYDQKRK